MIVIYIIGGILFLVLAIMFIDKRERMSHDIKALKQKRQALEETNRQLDELQAQLDEINGPLAQLNEFSKKALKFFRR